MTMPLSGSGVVVDWGGRESETQPNPALAQKRMRDMGQRTQATEGEGDRRRRPFSSRGARSGGRALRGLGTEET